MKILLTEEQIQDRVRQLAGEVHAKFRSQETTEIVVVGILTGCLMFLADLVRGLELPMQIGFVQAHSYRGKSTSAGEFEFQIRGLPDVANRHVVLVDDIFDSGQTLRRLAAEIEALQPASLLTAVLLAKQVARPDEFRPDLVGFEIPPEFVVGYGLDFDGRYRNLPYIGVLDGESESAAASREEPVP